MKPDGQAPGPSSSDDAGSVDEGDSVAAITARYPSADMTPDQFEEFVASTLQRVGPSFEDFRVTLHDRVTASDGNYTFDATVRYELAGLSFLVLVEAKRHKNPIKRELVQTLHQKMTSVGGQKAVLFSTSPLQRGALEFAKAHGVALVTVTEGRFTLETKSVDSAPELTREDAARRFGLPMFVGHAYAAGDTTGSTLVTLISPEHPEYIAELLTIPEDGAGEGPV